MGQVLRGIVLITLSMYYHHISNTQSYVIAHVTGERRLLLRTSDINITVAATMITHCIAAKSSAFDPSFQARHGGYSRRPRRSLAGGVMTSTAISPNNSHNHHAQQKFPNSGLKYLPRQHKHQIQMCKGGPDLSGIRVTDPRARQLLKSEVVEFGPVKSNSTRHVPPLVVIICIHNVLLIQYSRLQ